MNRLDGFLSFFKSSLPDPVNIPGESDTIMSCSVGTTGFSGNGSASLYEWTEEGPVYGPNGLLELDPANNRCYFGQRPVFATCKNNCPGGELQTNFRGQTECFFLS